RPQLADGLVECRHHVLVILRVGAGVPAEVGAQNADASALQGISLQEIKVTGRLVPDAESGQRVLRIVAHYHIHQTGDVSDGTRHGPYGSVLCGPTIVHSSTANQ